MFVGTDSDTTLEEIILTLLAKMRQKNSLDYVFFINQFAIKPNSLDHEQVEQYLETTDLILLLILPLFELIYLFLQLVLNYLLKITFVLESKL